MFRKKGLERTYSGSGVMELSKSVAKLEGDWNNAFSSMYFSAIGHSPHEQKAEIGCRACLYQHQAFKGDYLCLNAGDEVPDLSNFQSGDRLYEFRNEASSVSFITDHCKEGEELTVELYSRANF